jgi:drug/metabolite transporter (DMT)-like permease
MKTSKWSIALVILVTVLISVAQGLFKVGAEQLPVLFTNWPLILGLFLYAISTGFLVYAFKGGSVSVLYPILATGYIWVALISMFILGETISPITWGGIALIIGGIACITR